MTLQELLNSDMDLASLSALARQGFSWWIDELSSMLPPSWRARFSSGPRVLAEPAAGGGWHYWHDRRPVGPVRPVRASSAGVGLLLPPEAVLLRETTAPRMPAPDVRRMLALDIDRLSPLAPDLIHFDMEVVDRDAGDGRQRVMLGIVPRQAARDLVEQARAEGMIPASLGVRTGEDPAEERFDFLPAILEAAGEKPGGGATRYLWGAVAALLVINLAVLIGRDIADVDHLSRIAEAQRPAVTAALAIRGRVEAEDRRRQDLLARGQRGEPLRMLDALTEALPASVWVQHLEWNGQAVRIIGFKPADFDLAAALRGSGAFTNPRALTPEPTTGTLPVRPFDIAADARPAPHP